MIESINNSRTAMLANVIYGLGIDGIGLAGARLICRYFEDDVYKVIDEYNEELSIETWQEDNYFNIEDNMFNSYSILPILFYNENIVVNDNITGVTLDCNGNIDFSAIRK